MDDATRICLSITASQAAREVLEYEAVAAEFGFEPYGSAAEEVYSYNRHLASLRSQIEVEMQEIRDRIAELKQQT